MNRIGINCAPRQAGDGCAPSETIYPVANAARGAFGFPRAGNQSSVMGDAKKKTANAQAGMGAAEGGRCLGSLWGPTCRGT